MTSPIKAAAAYKPDTDSLSGDGMGARCANSVWMHCIKPVPKPTKAMLAQNKAE